MDMDDGMEVHMLDAHVVRRYLYLCPHCTARLHPGRVPFRHYPTPDGYLQDRRSGLE
jgi:hypothetical protein